MVCLAIFAVMACQGTTDSGGGVTPLPIKMVPITGGDYMYQGNTSKTVADFYLGETEVTQYQWKSTMGSAMPDPTNNSFSSGAGVNHPMYYVSWEDAIAFCNALSEKEGLSHYYDTDGSIRGGTGYRLPTEVEWEYAAGHGGFQADGTNPKARFTYAGASTESELVHYAWYRKNNGSSSSDSNYGSKEVKKKTPNDLGLYDMSGNVWEWCYDKYSDSGSSRVCRGGSWNSYASICRVAFRYNSYPSDRYYNLGLRVARSL